jgi:hypothetical protein
MHGNRGKWASRWQIALRAGPAYTPPCLLRVGGTVRQTGDQVLAEAAENDSIWGICMSERDALRLPVGQALHHGHNLLGEALMRVREEMLYWEVSYAEPKTATATTITTTTTTTTTTTRRGDTGGNYNGGDGNGGGIKQGGDGRVNW